MSETLLLEAESQDFFDRSHAALARRFPDLVSALAGLGEPKSRIVGSRADGTLNLDLGHTTLYDGSAERFTEIQLEAFRRRPTRFYMEPPGRRTPPCQEQYYISEALYNHLEDLQASGITIATTPADRTAGEGGYMVIYGVGLGLHLPELFMTARARHFVVVEEHAEFLLHALRLGDWAEILDRMEEAGQTLHFVIGVDPAVVSARVHWYMRGRGFGLIDGSYLYRHYSSTLLDHAYADFLERLPLLPVSIGYFEDELVMIDHATINLTRHGFRHFDAHRRLPKEVPAIVVGSGPSLDRTIEDLKRLAPNTILFSGGTALLPLLRNGIRPDFHCELENSPSSVEHLRRVAAEFSLDGITLLASVTVHPDMPSMFAERVFYFRDSVCSTTLWCPDGTGIHGTAPTCTNLALRAALVMQFREIYLFGVDLGTRQPDIHHSKDSIYPSDPAWKAHEADPVKTMKIALPGNLGGEAWTNQILHWARMMMAQSIDAFSAARIYNCGDGVAIPGTIPKLSRTIRVEASAAQRFVALGQVKREMAVVEAGQMAPVGTLRDLRAALERYYAGLHREIADAIDRSLDFKAFYDRVQPFLAHEGPEPLQPVLRSIHIGTLMMCFQIAYFFWRRVPAEARPGIMRCFLTALDQRLDAMAGRIDALVTQHIDQPATVASISQSTT